MSETPGKSIGDLAIREALIADLQAINEIYNHYVLTCTCTYQEEPETIAHRQAWFDGHDERYPVIVAEAGGEVVGWGALTRFHSRAAYRFTVEDSIYVRQDMQGFGVGGAILAELIKRAGALGYRSIIASIDAEQAPSIALHTKHGFTTVGRLKEVGYKFDRWLDVVYLQKTVGKDR